MDPLSVTSGIVGIVAFALQLAKTAAKVKKAVEEAKSAPQEARDLVERLVMLETSCQVVGFHLERRKNLPDHSSPTSSDIISKSLAQCLPRVQRLEQMLSELTLSDALVGTPRSSLDTVSRLRLVLRKGKISSLVQEIDRVMSLLQFVIQVDMWTMISVPLQPNGLCSSGIQVMDEALRTGRTSNTTLVDSAFSQSNLSPDIRRPTNRQCRTYRYLGYVTWTITDRWIGDETDNANHMTHRQGCITFRLPFSSTRLSMDYSGGMGTPSYALNVAHVIEEDSRLWFRIWKLMRPEGDPEELHKLVSRRELSLYSMYPFDGQEFNLFFVAVAKRWAEGCKYLLQHDFRRKFEEDETPEHRFGMMHPLSGKACEVTEMMLSVRSHDMRGTDIKYLLATAGGDVEYFSRYFNVFLKSSLVDHADILCYAWRQLVPTISVVLGRHDNLSSWVPALRCLIEHGLDIHRPIFASHQSSYLNILNTANHPFEADERAHHWLRTLQMCGVDLRSYMKAETALIEQFGMPDSYVVGRKRKPVMLDFEGLPLPSWRWEFVPGTSIAELLSEFQNFGYENMEFRLSYVFPQGPDDFQCWKAEEHYAHLGHYCFPFLLSPVDCIMGVYDPRLERRWYRDTHKGAVELRDKRFARRQAKKWRKAHPGEQPPSETMPGTWVD